MNRILRGVSRVSKNYQQVIIGELLLSLLVLLLGYQAGFSMGAVVVVLLYWGLEIISAYILGGRP